MRLSPTDPGQTRLLTIAAAADFLQVSPRYVWQLIASEKLTPVRLGRRCTRIDAAEIERLINAARGRSGR